MSEQKTSLIDQFSQAIQSVKDRITGYNSKVSEFKQGVNANADKIIRDSEDTPEEWDSTENISHSTT